MTTFTKESLKKDLCDIRDRGWIVNTRSNNDGGVGNMLEDLLGIEENNLPLPNAGEWELKTQKVDTKSLITLFHLEPSPTAYKFVSRILLPKYGWPHEEAGKKYPGDEKSFRQTITSGQRTDRGFTTIVNHNLERVEVSFDHTTVDTSRHGVWKNEVKNNVGWGELNPMPYWGFDDLFHKAGTKLHKTVYAKAELKRERGIAYVRYVEFMMLEELTCELWINAIEKGFVLVDFDARTGHNHGSKFRLRQNAYPKLFKSVEHISR